MFATHRAAGGVGHRVHAHHAVVAGGLFRRHPGHHAAGSGAVLRPAGVRHHPRARQRGQLHAHRGRAVRHGLRLLFRAAPPQTPPLTHPAKPLLPRLLPAKPQHSKPENGSRAGRGKTFACPFCAPDCTRDTNVLYWKKKRQGGTTHEIDIRRRK